MERDKEKTRETLRTPDKEFVYPAVFYHETESGLITLAVVLWDKNTAVRYSSSGTMYLNPAHYEKIRDVYRLSINSQSDERLYVIDNALDEDIQRILNEMDKRIPIDFSA
jgi:hypothetical protein